MNQEENILGKANINQLLRKFSIPCIISLLVNSLYNMVDQVFIGWGIGYLGNGATSVVFPLVMVSLAFALMLGDGTSAYLSLKLGEKKKEEASRGVANGILMSVIVSTLLCVGILATLPQLLKIFGCTEALEQYALEYGYIITIGFPFMMIGTTLNSIIRADGSPKYSMTSMILGAILNVILDPIFIFAFNAGIKGAAIATVVSQILTFIMNVMYIKKFKSITIDRKSFKFHFATARKVVMLGISSFITEMSIVFVIATENQMLGRCGANSKYGAEIPITVLGVVMKISQILNSIVIGLAAGSQPILGYNYGAGNNERVKKTLKTVLKISVVISTIAFLLFQLIPDKLILIFGSGDANYIEFACKAFRIYLMLCICNGIQIPSGIFFQAIGKSMKSAILSISRQIAILIPAMIILGNTLGIDGLLYAGPLADLIAFTISVILLISEIRKLSGTGRATENTDIKQKEHNNVAESKPIIITIAREYGSGGRYIGQLVAKKLGIKLYDKELIAEVAHNTGYSQEYIKANEQRREALAGFNSGYYFGLDNSDNLFFKEANTIRDIAQKESCVIVGRCADSILSDNENVTKVFIYSSMENKINRATKIYGVPKDIAEKEINRINKLRENHYKYYTEKDWGMPSNYDICINSDWIGVEKTADLICNFVK